MELLPTEYLPDDYTGPNAGTVEEIIGQYDFLPYLLINNEQ
jgi:hypothetical protein